MSLEQQRHDISDGAWEKIKPHTIGKKVLEEKMQKTQGYLLMECFGFCVPEPLGEIFHRSMAIGKMFIADFADGEIKAYGKIF